MSKFEQLKIVKLNDLFVQLFSIKYRIPAKLDDYNVGCLYHEEKWFNG